MNIKIKLAVNDDEKYLTETVAMLDKLHKSYPDMEIEVELVDVGLR